MSTSISSRSSSYPPTRQQLDELDALLQRMLDLPVNQLEELSLDKAAEAAKRKEAAPPAEVPAEIDPPPAEEPEPQPAVIEVGAAPEIEIPEEEAATEPAADVEPEPPLAPEAVDPVPPEAPEAATFVQEEPVAPMPPALPEGEQEEWVPLRSSWKPSAQTWPPLVEHWQQTQSTPPASPRSEYSPALMPSLSEPPAPEPQPEPEPEAADEPSLHTAITAAGGDPAWLAPLPPSEPQPLAEEGVGEAPWGLLPLVWFNQGFDACVQPLGPPGRWLASGGGKAFLGLLGLLSLGAAIALAVGDRIGWTW